MFFDDNEVEQYKSIFERTRDYLSQRFTREEKLQMMVREISSRLNEDFIRTVKICSLDFHYNFEPEVQERALNYLQNSEKCIKFKVLDIGVPIDLVKCECVEMPTMSEDEMFPHWSTSSKKVKEKAQEARYFEIEALPNFEEVAKKICGVGGDYFEMKYDLDTNNVFINGAYITNYRQNSINADVFEYLYSGIYKPGDLVKLSDIKATSRKMAQFKYDSKLNSVIFDAFFEVSGESFRFYPKIDSKLLTPERKTALNKAIEAELNSNRAIQVVF